MMKRLLRMCLPAAAVFAMETTGLAESLDASGSKNESKIGSLLLKKLGKYDKENDRQIMVYLTQKATFKQAKSMMDRKTRLKSMYDEARSIAAKSQESIVALLKANGFSYRQFYMPNMIVVKNSSKDLINTLSLRKDVDRILDNPIVNAAAQIVKGDNKLADDDQQAVAENLIAAGAEKVWNEFNARGENIVIAGQDTGVEWQHPALKIQYRGYAAAGISHDYNWHDSIHEQIGKAQNPCGYNSLEPCDDHNHGTHTVGTVVGDDQRGTIVGMAPKAKWIACRNMDAGNGRPSTYLECFEFFLAPYPVGGNPLKDGRPELAPHVINNSWGCPREEQCQGDEFLEVMNTMKTAGIMVVVSAGNDGSGCGSIATTPAHHTDASFSVGASNHRNDSIANFSSRGPSAFDGGIGPDVAAPGVGIKSAVRGGRYASSGWSGTSMAGPHVVGEVALLWSAVPSLIGKVDETIEIIRATARPQVSDQSCGGVDGTELPNNTFGYGIIDAFAAVEKARAAKGK